MGKIIYLKAHKVSANLPQCPLLAYWGAEKCAHHGISFTPSSSPQAFKIAQKLHQHTTLLQVLPREFIVVDYHKLLATIPLEGSDTILAGTVDDIPQIMLQIDNIAIEQNISCYNLVVYYSQLRTEIFVHYEDLHNDND